MIGINIIKIYINLCVKGQFATFCRCIVTVSFLIYLCILTSHTRFSYKVMLVSSGARSIALFSIYIFSTIALFCAFSVGNCTRLSFALRHLLTPFGIVNPFLFMGKTKINWKSLIVLHILH